VVTGRPDGAAHTWRDVRLATPGLSTRQPFHVEAELALELEELLGHPVDVVSTGGLKERDQHILSESIDL